MAHVDKLKDLVYTQKRTISIREVCYSLNVHVSEARRILEDFVATEDEENGSKLDVTYIVTGPGKDFTEDFKVHKLTYAKREELEETKKGFESIISCKIYSISLKNTETADKEASGKEIGSAEPFLDRDDLLKRQKLTYIVNEDIQLRADRLERLKLVSGIQINGHNGDIKSEEKSDEKESAKESVTKNKTGKEESKSSNKRNQSRKNNNKKQLKSTLFGSKSAPKKEKPNSSGDSGLSVESTPDPFSDDEEEKSPQIENEESQEMEVEPDAPTPTPVIKEESDDEMKQRNTEDSEDEAIVVLKRIKEVKIGSKKRKRIRVFDSDEEDDDTLALEILAAADEDADSNHSNVRSSLEDDKSPKEEEKPKKSKKKSKPSQPMETKTVSEEYTDEDGYTQVRLVKKLVPVEKSESENVKNESTENSSKDDKDSKSKKAKADKPVVKKQKIQEEEEEEESKPKGKKLSKAAQAKKGQVSITSFFKPAAKT